MAPKRRTPPPPPPLPHTLLTMGPLSQDATAQTIAAALHPVDPDFDPELFLAEALRLYMTIRAAWASAQLEGIRGILTGQLLTRLSARLDQCKLRGVLTEAIYPTAVTQSLVGATVTSSGAEQVRVLFESTGYIHDLDLDTLQPKSPPTLRRWRETWAFECTYPSRQTTRTERCPLCACPVDHHTVNWCPNCQVNLSPALHSFVVSRIEVVG